MGSDGIHRARLTSIGSLQGLIEPDPAAGKTLPI
jgi:hypothetical protein